MNFLPQLATVLVALVAALSAFATQRAASRANRRSQTESFRSDMEKEAFDRARTFDTETIIRQNAMVSDQRREIDCLRKLKQELSKKLDDCMKSQGDGHSARPD